MFIFIMKWKLVTITYCGLILFLSSLSPGEIPQDALTVPDKLAHFVIYAGLGIFCWGGFGRGGVGFPWAVFAFCVCFGIADECWQDWLDRSRTADVWDAATDALGAFSGIVVSKLFWKR